MLRWVIKRVLAGSHRPGYDGGYGKLVKVVHVGQWIEDVRKMGVNSIICLLDEDQLSYYSSIPGGLLEYYQRSGFDVRHVPAQDRQQPPLNEHQLQQIWLYFRELEEPVLVHCSAGMDRTGCATRFIQEKS